MTTFFQYKIFHIRLLLFFLSQMFNNFFLSNFFYTVLYAVFLFNLQLDRKATHVKCYLASIKSSFL